MIYLICFLGALVFTVFGYRLGQRAGIRIGVIGAYRLMAAMGLSDAEMMATADKAKNDLLAEQEARKKGSTV